MAKKAAPAADVAALALAPAMMGGVQSLVDMNAEIRAAMSAVETDIIGKLLGYPGALLIAMMAKDRATAERFAVNGARLRRTAQMLRRTASLLDGIAARADVAIEARADAAAIRAKVKEQAHG